ncbi:hypothetical protein DVG10_23395, partial [Salmonella enterica subsp. enterica serovar Cerro]|nr:hypothetical protein [Salmonella enterica subsp. enterica serovar Cerro]
MKKRNNTLDVARGISILSMVGLHSHLSDGFYYPIAHNIFVKFLMLYLVPFFFFISGVFYRNDSYKKLIFEKFSTIIKPVLFTVVFYNILFWDNDWYSIYCDIYGIFQFPLYALWFMPTLLTTILVCSVIIKTECKNIQSLSVILVLVAMTSYNGLIAMLGGANSDVFVNARFPFTAESLIFTIPIFMCGYYFRNNVMNFEVSIICLLSYIMLILFFVLKLGVVINIGSFVFKPYFICLVSSFFAIYILLCVSEIFQKIIFVSSFLRLCGRDSLYIALFHGPLLFYFGKIINYFHSFGLPMIIRDLIVFALSVTMPLFFKKILA